MLHKISDFCKKIDSLKSQSDKLYNLKYNNIKTPERDAEINHLIDDIQATCKLIGNDNKPYDNTNKNNKSEYGDYSGIDHDSLLNEQWTK